MFFPKYMLFLFIISIDLLYFVIVLSFLFFYLWFFAEECVRVKHPFSEKPLSKEPLSR